ncbi:MAG: hypothetical protein HOG49_41995 [Candidatus Scalindua sp.]|jgi:hypothetical protein|nr:hypothetical protein [Candidatus Scalindua sp.]
MSDEFAKYGTELRSILEKNLQMHNLAIKDRATLLRRIEKLESNFERVLTILETGMDALR